MTTGDDVTRMVQDYEADLAEQADSHEAYEVRALVQGLLAGTMVQQTTQGMLSGGEVELTKDDEGIYHHYFTVVTKSGLRFRVSVDVEK